jgi:hypothetical protein
MLADWPSQPCVITDKRHYSEETKNKKYFSHAIGYIAKI